MRVFVRIMDFFVVRITDDAEDTDWESVTSDDLLRGQFCFTTMPAGELAGQRCLLATEYRFSAQNLQHLHSRYGMNQ